MIELEATSVLFFRTDPTAANPTLESLSSNFKLVKNCQNTLRDTFARNVSELHSIVSTQLVAPEARLVVQRSPCLYKC